MEQLPVITPEMLTVKPQPTRITRIAIQRLHNLGNYESVRYEVTVDVSPTDNAGKVLATLETALEDIRAKSFSSTWDIERAQKKLAKPEDFEPWEIENAKETITQHEAVLAKREAARQILSSFSLEQEHRDAKDNWEDDYND